MCVIDVFDRESMSSKSRVVYTDGAVSYVVAMRCQCSVTWCRVDDRVLIVLVWNV